MSYPNSLLNPIATTEDLLSSLLHNITYTTNCGTYAKTLVLPTTRRFLVLPSLP